MTMKKVQTVATLFPRQVDVWREVGFRPVVPEFRVVRIANIGPNDDSYQYVLQHLHVSVTGESSYQDLYLLPSEDRRSGGALTPSQFREKGLHERLAVMLAMALDDEIRERERRVRTALEEARRDYS